MYNENEKNHFFRDLIVKILLVLLFIFLLMWLVPMPNLNPFYDKIFTQNMNSMTDAARSYYTTGRLPKVEGETKKLTLGDMINNKMLIEFTDSEGKKCDNEKSYVEVTKKDSEYIFKTNLSCSKQEDYVIEYYGCYDLCSDGNCGEVNNGNNSSSSDSSKNTSVSNENTNTTSISTDIVKGSVTTKKITEYQFSKKNTSQYIDKYTCANGYTLKGDKCIIVTEIEKQEDASIKCLAGYLYNSKTNKCEKLDTIKEDATLNCPSGYIYATSLDKCIKGSDDLVDATVSYTCSEGVLVGTKCVITDTKLLEARKVYSCSVGTLSGTKCIISGQKEIDATKVYSCSVGTLSGTKCIISTRNDIDATKVYSCSKGTISGTKCKINDQKEVDATKVYSCSEGTLSGTKCIIQTSSKVQARANYSCSEGTLDGTKCVIVNKGACGYTRWVCSNKTYTTSKSTSSTPTFTRRYLYQIGTSRVYEECNRVYKCEGDSKSTVDARLTYSCSNGTLSGAYCIVSSTKEVDATLTYKCSIGTLNGTKCMVSGVKEVDATLTYKCSTGTLSGTKCKLNETSEVNANVSYVCDKGTLTGSNKCLYTNKNEVDAKKVYSCPTGKLNGTKCEISNINTAEKVYTCKYGTLSGKYCLVSTTDSREPIYYCKEGYTLADKKCYVMESSTDLVNATPVYKTKTETVYKWSKSEKLDGWTRTGKTRIVEVAITSRG